MKTHLINIVYRKGLLTLLILVLGGWGTAWGQWSGANYTDDQTIDMTGDVTMTGTMTINGCTVTIKPNGAKRTITRDTEMGGTMFYLMNGGVLKIEGTSSDSITIDVNNNLILNSPVLCYSGVTQLVFDYVTIKNATIQEVSAINMQTQTEANLNHCKFYNNSTSLSGGNNGYGGVIYMSTGTLTCTDCEFKSNSAYYGGAIYNTNGTVNCTGCVFQNNNATRGGAIYNNKTVTLNNCTFTGNTAENYGGALVLTSASASVTCNNGCSFSSNSAENGGGAIYAITNPTLNLTDCNITGNSSPGSGGAIYANTSPTLNLTRCNITGNSSTNSNGGAIYAGTDSNLNLTDCTITGNSAKTNSGGIYIAGNLTLVDCTITGNVAQTAYAGGVYFNKTNTNNSRNLKLSGVVVIKDNSADTYGPNLFLQNQKKPQSDFNNDINPSGLAPLSCGSSIGVTVQYLYAPYPFASPLQFANGTAANCLSAYYDHYFFCEGVRIRSTTTPYTWDEGDGYVYYSTAFPSPNSDGNLYVVPAGTANSWDTYADAAGCTISGGYVTHVNTAAGLAYLAKDIASGRNYSGKTVLLTADLNMAGHNWEPIGCTTSCSDKAFSGTFNGQGHTITGLSSTLLYDNMGLFGYVTGTVKNLVVASSTITSSATNLGGIAGELNGGSVYNCISTVTLSGGSGTNTGALVGKLTSGSVLNSFAISNDAACGSGTVTNCYVRKVSGGSASNMGTATNVGASGNTTGAFTETVTPYLYNHADNKVGSTALLTLLNAWVDAQSSPNDYARWTRTMASPINGDYPLLMLPGTKCVGTKSGNANVLNYGSSFNTMLGTHNASGDNIFLYASETGVNTGNGSANVYIAEDVALLHTSTITNAHVGVTLDPTNGTEGVHWHMFSPALSNAPLGISYPVNGSYTPAYGTLPAAMQPTLTGTGYFPATDYSGNSYYSEWDFYTYFEPQYHWINFKRNSDNHWHEDSNHENIAYTNESTLTPGRGYLVATDDECILEASGTLNPADGTSAVTISVTRQSAYRTGYNLLGNPYQAYLDFDAFADVNKALWGGNKDNASYLILNKDGYTYYAYSGSANTITANQYLHPHQGFMIVATASGTATFTNGMRSTTAAAFRGEHVDYPLVNLIATEEDGNRDITTIELGRPEAGGAFKQYDMHLGKGCIYTHYEDADYAIAFTRPGLSEIGIRFETDEDAAYTLTWDMENGEFSYLHLIDNMTGSDIDCLRETEYRFTSRPSDYKSRFKLVFEYTGIDEPEEGGPSTGSETFAFIMGNELVVNCGPSTGSGTAGTATLQMFDMTGRLVMEKAVSGVQTTTVLPELTAGVYVLRLSDKNGTKVQKIVIE